jgi:hypothetical protein
MKVITAIYLNCRANLRDEWLLGVDLDGEVEDSFVCPISWSSLKENILKLMHVIFE